MKKETADLVDLQELFEIVGPRIFLDDFDVSSYVESIKNQDGVLVPSRIDLSSYVPSETAIWITENSSELNQIDSYYDGISAAENGFFDLVGSKL